MSLLSHDQLLRLVADGVITGVTEDMVNAASIDITVGPTFFVEATPAEGDAALVSLQDRQPPAMLEVRAEGRPFILPAGGFCLAHSQQKFYLPANISAEYKLKSSLARVGLNHLLAGWCFVADTEVPMLDGSVKRIADVQEGEWVYSLRPDGSFAAGKVTRAGKSGVAEELVTVLLDNGEWFRCTPGHEVMLRNGEYLRADALTEGTALMPFLRKIQGGYERVYCPHLATRSNWKKLHGYWEATHRLVCPAEMGSVVHHRNENKADNRPSNLEVLAAGEHGAQHRAEYAKSTRGRETSARTARERNRKLWEDPEFRASASMRASGLMKGLNKKIWNDPAHRARMSALSKERYAATIGSVDRTKLQRMSKLGQLRKVITDIMSAGASVSRAAYTADKRQNAPTVETLEREFGTFELACAEAGYQNHKVVSVTREVVAPTDVYDLTIEGTHNFALACGVVVHNCDAGWNGSVLTLELHNVLRRHSIAIREGDRIGQMIFFHHESVPERASYAARGRYNGDNTVRGMKP